MACSAIRSPLLRNSSVRHYASAATAAAQCAPVTSGDIKVLANKVTVAAVDNNSPVAQVSIVFRAGSRNETYETQGISHMLRLCTALTTTRTSGFLITRKLQQLGGELSTTTDREYTSYNLKIHRDNLSEAYSLFEDAATRPEFRPWEIADEISRLRWETSNVSPNVKLVELLYKAAYRHGLGNSLYCPKRHIGKLSSETLKHFVNNNFTASNCALVATGIPLNEAESLATSLELSSSAGQTHPSKYLGGEVRKDRTSELTHVAVAVEGVGLNNRKDTIALAVLQKIGGEGPQVKWGNGHGALQKAVEKASSDPFAAIAFNANHTDTGLFGVLLACPFQNSGAVLKAATKWLRNPTFSDQDVQRGKNNLKAAVLAAGDDCTSLHEGVVQQAIFTGSVVSTQLLAAEIDKISPADIKNVAGKFSSSKLSLASIGNLANIPYLDQL